MDDCKVSDPFCQGQDEVAGHPGFRHYLRLYHSTDQPSGYHSDELPSEGSSPRNSARDSRRKIRRSHSPRHSKHNVVPQSISPPVVSPSKESVWSILDSKVFECNWDLPSLVLELFSAPRGSSPSGDPYAHPDVIGVEKDLFDMLTLTKSERGVKVLTCREYVVEMYGTEGVRLLSHIIRAQVSDDCKSGDYLWDLLLWVCLTFRRPVRGNVCVSTGIIDGSKVTLKRLTQLERPANTCWLSLFETAVIASDPRIQPEEGFHLNLNFHLMLQLAAVEYPVIVDSGLVLMGYSTALVPVRKDHESVLWHLETANHDFQLRTTELAAVKRDWMKTTRLEDLQTKTVLLGWCPEAVTQLGTKNVNSTIGWSDAKPKHTTWSWTGASLQLIATSVSPFQIGGGFSIAFERRINTLRFSPQRNYAKCLRSSAMEPIILYDVSESRAWLVPLIIVFHQMLLAYCERIPEVSSKGTVPIMKAPSIGADQSLRHLQSCGSLVIEGSGDDKLTVRELILGLSVNMSKARLHAPRRCSIFGYEFMDIVTDSPRSELKTTQIDKEGLAWSFLLSEVNCLFCSQLGDVIVGLKSSDIKSLCNRLPKGSDWLATTIRTLDILHRRSGGRLMSAVRRLGRDHYWSLTGSPFQKCDHGNASHTSCWDTSSLLQEIKSGKVHEQENEPTDCVPEGGAVVFGQGKRPVLSSTQGSDSSVEMAVPDQVIEPSAPISTERVASQQQRDISTSLSFETLTDA
ncbi:hypothetical protein APSETT445_006092 [Aspergillus pseudonomiae]